MPDQMIPTIGDLLDAIDRLPGASRSARVRQLEAALDLDQGGREVAIGLLALDLATMDVQTCS